jgi:rhamnogalacturonyl hydrolase YesR
MKFSIYSQTVLGTVLLAASFLNADILIRNAFSTSDGNPRFLVDGVAATGWSSGNPGETVSFLLDGDMDLEAYYTIVTGDAGEPPAYQLLASGNYRDWILVGEGPGFTLETPGPITEFNPVEARYLRFVSLSDESVSWELFAGTRTGVEEERALFEPVDWGDITDRETILGMLDLAFSWQMDHLSTRQDGIGWVNGAFYSGVTGLYAVTGDPDHRQAILDIGNSVNWTLRTRSSGKTFYHADDHCIGQSWLELYLLESNPQDRWITDVRERHDRIMADPLPGRVDMDWCDALYMSPPNYTRLYAITGDEAYLSFIDRQWWDVTDFLYDPDFNLFYRDASYIPDREPNGMPVFWSRGNGWVIGGLVRLLDYLPPDWPRRADYENLLQEMAAALAAAQKTDDGLWSSSLLYPEKYDGEPETSGSAFFTYGIAWGVNRGILDATEYGPVIERAWEGLTGMLSRNGTLGFIQQIGAGPARNNGLLTDKDYGYGAFLLAGVEMIRYFDQREEGRDRGPWARAETAVFERTGNPEAWTLVDDFEDGFDWTVRKSVTHSEELVADPFDDQGSLVFSLYTGTLTPGDYRATTGIPAIAEGRTATVYQRFSYDSPEIDVLLGISDVPVVGNYNDYENGVRVYFQYNQLEARSGGAYTRIGDDLLQLETWYEVWTVIDNATDTYSVYLAGGSNYPEITLMESGIPFRNGTISAIVSYALSYNTDYCDGRFYLDDVHIDQQGINLTRPAGVRQPAYSPWSQVGRNPETLAKSTPNGFLWDEAFPWIYHWELGSWLHVQTQDRYEGGIWAWNPEAATWVWLSRSWPGWAYIEAEGIWIRIDSV